MSEKHQTPFLDIKHCQNNFEMMKMANERNMAEKWRAIVALELANTIIDQFANTVQNFTNDADKINMYQVGLFKQRLKDLGIV